MKEQFVTLTRPLAELVRGEWVRLITGQLTLFLCYTMKVLSLAAVLRFTKDSEHL